MKVKYEMIDKPFTACECIQGCPEINGNDITCEMCPARVGGEEIFVSGVAEAEQIVKDWIKEIGGEND